MPLSASVPEWRWGYALDIADGAFGGSAEGQLQLSYIDSEGDRCAIGWDQELIEAQRDADEGGRLLKIIVEEGSTAKGAHVEQQPEDKRVDDDEREIERLQTGTSAGDSDKDRRLLATKAGGEVVGLNSVIATVSICAISVLALLLGAFLNKMVSSNISGILYRIAI